MALDYEISSGFGVFGAYKRVFRGPDVIESMYASGTGTLREKSKNDPNAGKSYYYNYDINNDLKATTGNAYEAGVRYKNELGKDSYLSLSAKYFLTNYKNLINDTNSYQGTTNSTLVRSNVGNADIDGVEIFARLNISNLSLGTGYTHQKVKYKNRTKTKCRGGNATAACYQQSSLLGYRDQGDKYTFNAEYFLNAADLLLGYNLIFMGSKNVTSANEDKEVRMPSYAVSDIYATYMPGSGRLKGFEINAGIYNLFNKQYASHSQRTKEYTGDAFNIDYEPGRNFKVNLSYKF